MYVFSSMNSTTDVQAQERTGEKGSEDSADGLQFTWMGTRCGCVHGSQGVITPHPA